MGIKITGKTHPVSGRTYSTELKEVVYERPDGSGCVYAFYDPTEETEAEVMAKIKIEIKNSVIKNVNIYTEGGNSRSKRRDSKRSYAKTDTYYNPAHIVFYKEGVYGPNLKTVDPDTGESLEISSGVYGETVKRRNPKTKAYSKEKPGVYGVKKIIYDPVTGMETSHSPGVYGVKISHRILSAPNPSLAAKVAIPAVKQAPVPSPPPVAFEPPPVAGKAQDQATSQASPSDYQAIPNLAESWLLTRLQGEQSAPFDQTLMLKRLRNGEYQLTHHACEERLAWAKEHIDWLLLGLNDDAFWAPLQGQPFQEWSRLLALSSEPLALPAQARLPLTFKQRLTLPLRVIKRSIKIKAFWADRIFGSLVLLPILLLLGLRVALIGSTLSLIWACFLFALSCLLTYLEIRHPIPWLQPLRHAQAKYQQVATEIVLEDNMRSAQGGDITLDFPEDAYQEISSEVFERVVEK